MKNENATKKKKKKRIKEGKDSLPREKERRVRNKKKTLR